MRLFGAVWRRRPRAWLCVAIVCILGSGYLIGRQVWAEFHVRRAETELALSLRLRTRIHLAEARRHLDRALRVWPDHPRLHFMLARAARRAGDIEEAAHRLRRAEDLGWVAEAIELERALAAVQQGDLALEPLLHSFVKRGHPDALLILEALVQGCLLNYQLPRTLAYLNEWLAADPESARALVWRGETLLLLAQTTEALADYRRAVELDPQADGARLKLADVLLAVHEPDEAWAHLTKLRERQPDQPDVLYGLARCRLEKGEEDDAVPLLDRLLEVKPDHGSGLCKRGKIALAAGKLAEAEPWLRRAALAAPFEPEVLHALSSCLDRTGHAAEASTFRARLDAIDADRKRLRKLKSDIISSPKDPSLRCEMGRILLRNGQTREGIRWLRSALRIDPKHGPSRQALQGLVPGHGQPAEKAS